LADALDRKVGVETNEVAMGLKSGIAANGEKLTYVVARINGLAEDNEATGEEFRHLLNGLVRSAQCQCFTESCGHLLTGNKGITLE
jgi:hypothetical protein